KMVLTCRTVESRTGESRYEPTRRKAHHDPHRHRGAGTAHRIRATHPTARTGRAHSYRTGGSSTVRGGRGGPDPPGRRRVVRRQRGGTGPAERTARSRRYLHPPERAAAAQLLPRAVGPGRRGPGGE